MRQTQNKKVWEHLNKYGNITSYEMFDKKTEGWDVWGNEVECDIELLQGGN